jgi:HK97 family phage prohead protease
MTKTLERRSVEHRVVKCRVLETRAAGDGVPAQAWIRVNDYTQTDTYGTRFAPGGCKAYMDAHPNRPTFLYGHGMQGGIHSVLGHAVDWREDNTGLDVLMEFDDFDAVPAARQAYAQLQSGTFDSFSVGFIREMDQRDPTDSFTIITQYQLPEVSIVVEASNAGTGLITLSGTRGSQADVVAGVLLRMATGELSLTDALAETRDALAHPAGDTGSQVLPSDIVDLASNVDAAVDAIRAELTTPTSDDNSQALALVGLAESACDALLDALDVGDPDDAPMRAARDAERRSTAPNAVQCPVCKGKGTILRGNRKCPVCKGDGKVLPKTAVNAGRSDDFTVEVWAAMTDEQRETALAAEEDAATEARNQAEIEVRNAHLAAETEADRVMAQLASRGW